VKGLHNLAAHAQPRGAALYNPFRVARFASATQMRGSRVFALGYGVPLLRSESCSALRPPARFKLGVPAEPAEQARRLIGDHLLGPRAH